MIKLFAITERESGNTVVSNLSEKEANMVLYNLENTDKLDGNYTSKFYKIIKLYHAIKINLN